MKFNEDARVKIPSILHLMRLGYQYLSLKDDLAVWDTSTNIFTTIFTESIQRINPNLSTNEISNLYSELALCLENEDLGKAFYEKLVAKSGNRLIDFENFNNNSFHVVTELPCIKDDEEFRPDITMLINGMPLVFIEVKIPNNRDGVLAEHKRLQTRFKNKKFRTFANITQLMVFSNNMEYAEDTLIPIEGVFYATTSYKNAQFVVV
jgi:type I restriction enzyme R subunit